MTKHCPIEFSISAGVCLYGSLLLLLFPLKLVISIVIAASIHELSHLLMLRCFHVPVSRISISVGGAVIHTAPLLPWQELICAAAGPMGSFLCMVLIRVFPVFSLCAFIQGLFNLLPVYPLDGGRILQSFCLWFCPEYTATVCRISRWCVCFCLGIVCCFLSYRTGDVFFLLLLAYFMVQLCPLRKSP